MAREEERLTGGFAGLGQLAGRSRGAAKFLSGLDRTAKNIRDLRLKKEELSRDRQKFEIEKKKGDLEIKQLELEVGPNAVAAAKEDRKLKTQKAKVDFQLAERELEKERVTEEERGKRRLQFAIQNQQQIQEVERLFGVQTEIGEEGLVFKQGKDPKTLTAFQDRNVRLGKQQVIEAIRSGIVFDDAQIGGTLELETPEEVIAFATSKDVDLSDPEIVQALQQGGKFDFSEFLGTRGAPAKGSVRMQAPDTSIAIVPKNMIEQFLKKGAKIVE